jgi:hypothetical protein
MQMQIEEFACSEMADATEEQNQEVLELVEKLGLDGQSKLKTGIMPYPEVTGEQKFVLDVLTPTRVNVKQYSRTAIPLRVLQIAAHATEIGFFEEIQVWDTKGVEKDPVLVGKKSYTYYLLARWGEHLDNWTMMAMKATKMAKMEMIGKLNTLRSDLDTRLARLGSDTFCQEDLTKTGFYV